MKFLRHLAAVMLVVAVVVVAGLAWQHFGASTLAGGLRGPVKVVNVPGGLLKGLPPGTRLTVRPGPHGPVVVRSSGSGGMSLGLDSMFQAVNLPVLRHTVEIEVGVIAAVVILDIARRRLRRFLRTHAWLQASGSVDELADQVGVTVVPCVLLDHVRIQPAQVDGDRLVPELLIQWPALDDQRA